MRSLHVCALFAALTVLAGGPASAQGDADSFLTRRMPYEAFDRLPATHVAIGKTSFDIAFAPGVLDLSASVIIEWIAASGRTVAAYYGRFPVDHVKVLVVPVDGAGVRSGTAFAHRGARYASCSVALSRNGSSPTTGSSSTSWYTSHFRRSPRSITGSKRASQFMSSRYRARRQAA